MARFDLFPRPGYDDLGDVNSALFFGPPFAPRNPGATSTFVEFALGDEVYRVTGEGLSYDASGRLVGGTIKGVSTFVVVRPTPTSVRTESVFGIIALDVGVSALQAAQAGGGSEAFWGLLLGGADTVNGSASNDLLPGYGGADRINAAEGDDTLDGGAGADTLTGGAGNDVYRVDSAADRVVETGGGADTILASVSYALGAPFTVGSVEALVLEHAAGNSSGTGSDGANTLIGNGWNNTLDGVAGDDVIEAGNGADVVVGRTGNDTVFGGGGGDAIDGNEGNDVLLGEGDGDVIFGRAGHDTIAGGDDNDILMGEEGLEIGTGNDVIAGGWGTDQLNGGAGNDSLYGEGGIDMITGGTGNDLIAGMGGIDAIAPGPGADTLIYYALSDFFGGDAGEDYLVGIEVGVDVFDLRQIFDGLGAPDGTPAALRGLGWFRAVQQGGDALLQVDGNGGGDGFATAARLVGVNAAGITDAMFLV